MTNVIVALIVLGFVGLAVLLVIVLRRWRSEEQAREAEREKTRKAEESKEKSLNLNKVVAGTHLEDGRLRCVLRPCPLAATMPELHLAREDLSFVVWLQRRYGGARQRVRIVPGKRLKYCAAHAAAVHARYQHRAATSEARLADFVQHEDSDLSEFEISVDEMLSADLALKREAQSVPPPSKAPTTTLITKRP